MAAVSAWYHHPDFRWGDASKFGALQFLQTPDERVYYRVYGKDGLRQTGREADVSENAPLVSLPWKPMAMQFQVTAHLPRAVKRSSVVPKRLLPGVENAEGLLLPAATLHTDRRQRKSGVLGAAVAHATRVQIDKSLYLVRYRNASKEADFSLALKRAYQTTDPGTNRPASFQSDVLVSDKKAASLAAARSSAST